MVNARRIKGFLCMNVEKNLINEFGTSENYSYLFNFIRMRSKMCNNTHRGDDMNMEVRDAINLFGKGASANEVAKLVEMTGSGFKKKIKNLGFKYEDEKWVYQGDDASMHEHIAPLTSEGMKVVSDENWKPQQRTNTSNNTRKKTQKSKEVQNLSPEEISVLKEMISNYKGESYSQTSRADLVNEMNRHGVGVLSNRKRQSYNVSEEVRKDFENLSKDMRVSQSDLIELAMIELVNKYQG